MSIRLRLSNLYRQTERHVLSTRFGDAWSTLKWRYRHVYRHSWARRYLHTAHAPHRLQFIEIIQEAFPGCPSICEYGCASGVNLFNFRESGVADCYAGFDINPSGIRVAKRHARRIGATEISFERADFVRSESPYLARFDVVVTDSVLMFIGHIQISITLRKMWNSAERGMVLHEFNGTPQLEGGRYIHDFAALMAYIDPTATVCISKSPKADSSQWSQYGSFICVTRSDNSTKVQQV